MKNVKARVKVLVLESGGQGVSKDVFDCWKEGEVRDVFRSVDSGSGRGVGKGCS